MPHPSRHLPIKAVLPTLEIVEANTQHILRSLRAGWTGYAEVYAEGRNMGMEEI